MPDQYHERTYRRQIASDLAVFLVSVGETDLQISAERPLADQARSLVLECRRPLEDYLASHPHFQEALVPWPADAQAPEIVRRMCQAGVLAGVGPMAAVAGAVAECVGQGLAPQSYEVIVENGGDIFLRSRQRRLVRVFAGPSPLSDRLAVAVGPTQGIGVCTSSGTVGPSLSFGRADAATVISADAALADATATALGNLVRSPGDLQPALQAMGRIPGVLGALVVIGDRLGAWGEIELEPLQA